MTKPLPKLVFGARFANGGWVNEDGTPASVATEGVEVTRFKDGAITVQVGNRYEGFAHTLSAEEARALREFLN